MTRIEITIQNGKVTWIEQKGEELPAGMWAELNIDIRNLLDKHYYGYK